MVKEGTNTSQSQKDSIQLRLTRSADPIAIYHSDFFPRRTTGNSSFTLWEFPGRLRFSAAVLKLRPSVPKGSSGGRRRNACDCISRTRVRSELLSRSICRSVLSCVSLTLMSEGMS